MSVGEWRDAMKNESGGSAPYRYVTVFKPVTPRSILALCAAE